MKNYLQLLLYSLFFIALPSLAQADLTKEQEDFLRGILLQDPEAIKEDETFSFSPEEKTKLGIDHARHLEIALVKNVKALWRLGRLLSWQRALLPKYETILNYALGVAPSEIIFPIPPSSALSKDYILPRLIHLEAIYCRFNRYFTKATAHPVQVNDNFNNATSYLREATKTALSKRHDSRSILDRFYLDLAIRFAIILRNYLRMQWKTSSPEECMLTGLLRFFEDGSTFIAISSFKTNNKRPAEEYPASEEPKKILVETPPDLEIIILNSRLLQGLETINQFQIKELKLLKDDNGKTIDKYTPKWVSAVKELFNNSSLAFKKLCQFDFATPRQLILMERLKEASSERVCRILTWYAEARNNTNPRKQKKIYKNVAARQEYKKSLLSFLTYLEWIRLEMRFKSKQRNYPFILSKHHKQCLKILIEVCRWIYLELPSDSATILKKHFLSLYSKLTQLVKDSSSKSSAAPLIKNLAPRSKAEKWLKSYLTTPLKKINLLPENEEAQEVPVFNTIKQLCQATLPASPTRDACPFPEILIDSNGEEDLTELEILRPRHLDALFNFSG